MLTQLSQLKDLLDKSHKPKKLILAASEDAHSLNAVVHAANEKIIRPILVGDRENPQPEFQQAMIEAVAQITHIAPADENG